LKETIFMARIPAEEIDGHAGNQPVVLGQR
jgi:hypothetical protein